MCTVCVCTCYSLLEVFLAPLPSLSFPFPPLHSPPLPLPSPLLPLPSIPLPPPPPLPSQYYMFYDIGASSTTATIAEYKIVQSKERGMLEKVPQLTIKVHTHTEIVQKKTDTFFYPLPSATLRYNDVCTPTHTRLTVCMLHRPKPLSLLPPLPPPSPPLPPSPLPSPPPPLPSPYTGCGI